MTSWGKENGFLCSPLTFWEMPTYTCKYAFCESRIHIVWKLPKCCIWIFELWHFRGIFVQLKLTCLVTMFDSKIQAFKKIAKMFHFWHFYSFLSTQNIRFMRLFLWFSNTVGHFGLFFYNNAWCRLCTYLALDTHFCAICYALHIESK